MKRLILFALLSSLLMSCTRIGGWQYKSIYIYEDGNLVEAHGYKLKVPSEGGEVTFDVVSFGVRLLKYSGGSDFVTVADIKWPLGEDDVYEKGPFPNSQHTYKQTISLSIPQNTKASGRKSKMTLFSDAGNGYRAEITIRQAGR